MKYDVISADCHVDLIWLPPDLFTANSSAAFKDRMPYVTDGPRGKEWVTKNGSSFGLMNGMGSGGRQYIAGQIHRSDRMASTGLYDDGKKGIRRTTDPELRLKDQERDGVQAEVLYGILGATIRIKDNEAAGEMLRIYNEWLADFCATHPDRYAGLACIPNHDAEAAIGEIERVARRGVARGLEISRRHDMAPLWDPWWNPVWDAVAASGLPLHFHTIGGGNRPDTSKLAPKVQLAARAAGITNFQMHMADVLLSMIFCGALERHPGFKVIIGEAGIGWIPYVLNRMDAEWEDQFKERILAAPVLCDLSDRSGRHQAGRGDRRRQHHVGFGLPAPGRHLAGFAGIHREGTRPSARSHPPQDRLRERREALPLRELIGRRPGPVG